MSDELPISEAKLGGGGGSMSEFAEGADASSAGAAVDTRPLIERIKDANWKTRSVAYADLCVQLRANVEEKGNDGELYAEFGPVLAKMTSDANPAALDAGLDAALVFADLAPAGTMRSYVDKVCANVVDKTFGARVSTQSKGKALLHKLVEVDESAPIASILLAKLSDKKVRGTGGFSTQHHLLS